MLGLAIGRRAKGLELASSCGQMADATVGKKGCGGNAYELPWKAKIAEQAFENGDKVRPFRFPLDLPAKYWKK